jgi:hypothetical protein
MKVVYTTNPQQEYPGYDKVTSILFEFDSGELEYLYVDMAHQNHSFGDLGKSLKSVFDKVELGGTIAIRGVNLDSVCDAVLTRRIGVDQAHALMYTGAQRSVVNLRNVVDLLKSYGANVVRQRVNPDLTYYVEATRNV